MSPATSRTCKSTSSSPRLSTSSTPQIDMPAPSHCFIDMRIPKNTRPISSIQTGVIEPTKVTLMGVEVLSAKYRRALYPPILSRLSQAKRRQHCHSGLLRRSTGAASGSSRANAILQRNRLSVIGETIPVTKRPTTALPAHSNGGTVSKRAAGRVSLRCMG